MKNKIFTAIFTFVALAAFGQSKMYQYGANVYTNASKPLYVAAPDAEWQADVLAKNEKPKVNVGGNFFVMRNFSPRLSASVGLGYASYGEVMDTKNGAFEFPEDLDPFFGFVRPAEPLPGQRTKFTYTVHSIEIPVQIRYVFWQQFYAQGGASLLTQVARTQKTMTQKENENRNHETKNITNPETNLFNLGLNFGLGYTFLPKAPVQYFVALNSQYVAFGTQKDVAVNRKYLSAGVALGVRF